MMSRPTRRRTYRSKPIACPGPCNPRNRCPTIPNNNINKGDNAGTCPLGWTEMVPCSLSRKPAVNRRGHTQRPTHAIDWTLKKSARGRSDGTPAMQTPNDTVGGISRLSSPLWKCCMTVLLLIMLHTLAACIAFHYNWHKNFTALQLAGVFTTLLWQITGHVPF